MKKVILTGAIGSGKSTVLRAAMQRLGWATPAGYFTHWDGQPLTAELIPWIRLLIAFDIIFTALALALVETVLVR